MKLTFLQISENFLPVTCGFKLVVKVHTGDATRKYDHPHHLTENHMEQSGGGDRSLHVFFKHLGN